MKVALRQLCSYGAMHPDRDLMSGPEIVGELGMVSRTGKGWARRYASLRPLDSHIAPDLVPKLWEPELEALGNHIIRLRGLQASKEGAKDMHMQVWLCRLV